MKVTRYLTNLPVRFRAPLHFQFPITEIDSKPLRGKMGSMEKIKDTLRSDIPGIRQSIIGGLVVLAITILGTFILAQADALNRLGWSAMNQWLALFLYVAMALGYRLSISSNCTML